MGNYSTEYDAPPRRHRAPLVAALLVGLVVLGGCQELARLAIRFMTPEYKPEGVLAEAAFDGPDEKRDRIAVSLVPVSQGYERITDIQFVPGQPARMLVLEKNGRLLQVDVPGDKASEVAKLDVLTDSEQGLLGLTFHPNFKTNRRLYLNVVQSVSGVDTTRILEYEAASAADLAKGIQLRRTILEVAQPYQNHNAGQLAFGPDGMLYIGLGDGGLKDDPYGHGQKGSTLLGSMLRVAVTDAGSPPYTIPADNPFVGRSDFRPEAWAYGFRNPWRYSFGPGGRLIVADVGQNKWEEVDIVERGGNYGWKVYEARHCFDNHKLCGKGGYRKPIFEYTRADGGSITGGFVALGNRAPALKGKYLFGDFLSGRLWALDLPKGSEDPAKVYALGRRSILISTFGRDEAGDVYLADYGKGTIYRIEK